MNLLDKLACMFCEEHFLLFNSAGDLFHCGDGGMGWGRRGRLIYGNPLCADDICQAVISIAFLTETITTPPLQTDQNYDKHEAALRTGRFNYAKKSFHNMHLHVRSL